MKVLVYGPYPPSLLPEARATLTSVREQVAAGAEVTVVSPVRSAAHHHAGLDGKGRVRLARWISGADAAVLHLPAVGLGNRVGQAAWQAVGLALRRVRTAEIHISPFEGAADEGWVRLVVRHADRVVAASEANRAALVAAGLPGELVDVRPAPARGPSGATAGGGKQSRPAPLAGSGGTGFGWDTLSAEASPADVQAEVERQAARLRRDASRSADVDPAAVGAARVLLTLPPLLPPPPTSGRKGVTLVKTIVQRLTAWQAEPIVSRINEMQQATVLAFEEYSRQGRRPGDSVEE